MGTGSRPHHGRIQCSECLAKTVEYPHRLNKPLMKGIYAIYAAGRGPRHLESDLHLRYSVHDNFQKLQYWDLVCASYREDGSRIKGCWEITDRGIEFTEGNLQIFNTVWTYRGERVEYDGALVSAAQVTEGAQEREEWAQGARPHLESDE